MGHGSEGLWEIDSVWEVLREVAGDFGEGFELGVANRTQHHLITVFFDENLRARESEGLRQAHGLAASMLKDFCCRRSYVLYL